MILQEKLLPYRIFLGSASPRRQILLQELGIKFVTLNVANVEEIFPPELPLEEVPSYLASLKAKAYYPQLNHGDILITADTIVICENTLLGKPENEGHATEMLKFLSGKEHRVITGVTISNLSHSLTFSATTSVFFRVLTDEEIAFYLENFKPFDKAGAYGIQEWIGYVGIERIEGSYFNVMGLPVQRLYGELLNFVSSLK